MRNAFIATIAATALATAGMLGTAAAQTVAPAQQELSGASSPAQAESGQTFSRSGLTQGNAGLSARSPGPTPLFRFGDINAVIDAPAAAPNANIAYDTYEGQPMTGAQSVLAGAPNDLSR